MRHVLLAAILGMVLALSGRASAQTLGFHYGPYWGGPVVQYAPGYVLPAPVVPYAYPYAYPYPYPYYYPYPYSHSYFRPDGPYGPNAYRNWRDTWQDDGVKLHSYTLH